MRFLPAALVTMAIGALTPATGETQSTTPMERALDRAVVRVKARRDLREHTGSGFNRDSFDVQAFIGIGRVGDSALVRWFDNFSAYISGTDSTACQDLITGEPTASRLAAHPSTMDSVAMERWIADWEGAVVASYLAEPHAPVNDEEMMVAVFALIAKLPESELSLNRKPSDKPRKMSPQSECRMMRHFFEQAMAMDEPQRMTLFRGLAMTMNQKNKSPINLEQ
jgi:hypothetical protein